LKRPRLRASVLSAGYGTRLRPLTLFLPKPLLPIRGEPVVGYTLRRLAGVGCEAAVLNLHHLADAIPAELGRSYHGLPLRYTREEEILGTLGPLAAQRELLASAEVVILINGDTLCRWPLRAMLKKHRKSGADATLLLHRRGPEEALGGGVGVDSKGWVVQLRDSEPVAPPVRHHLFAGAHLLSPRLLERIGDGPGDIVADLYQPLLRDGGRIAAVTTRAPWHDLGTPHRYLEAALAATRGEGLFSRLLPRPRNHVSPLATVSPGAVVEHSIVEAGAAVEEGSKIAGSVLLEGARVASGSEIRDSLLGPGVHLPRAAKIEGRMITRAKIGYEPNPQESVMGELVYTPL
jgi:mannose-1-phosphate guanylyltransferase